MRTRSVPGHTKLVKSSPCLSQENGSRVGWNLLVGSSSPSADLELFEKLTLEDLAQMSIDLLNVRERSAHIEFVLNHVVSDVEYVTGLLLRPTTVLDDEQRRCLREAAPHPVITPQQFAWFLAEWKRAAQKVAQRIQEIG